MICVTGCMRNGTSLLTSMLAQRVVYVGRKDELYDGLPHDPKGIWEKKSIVSTNKRILDLSRADMIRVPFIEDFVATDWSKNNYMLWEETQGVRNQARHEVTSILLNKPDSFPLAGWKDPRNSLTLPFWYEVFNETSDIEWYADLTPLKVVWLIRHPTDSSESMARMGYGRIRNPEFFWKLWHIYNQSTLNFLSQGKVPYIAVLHSDLVSNPDDTFKRVLDFVYPEYSQEDFDAGIAQVMPSLHRHGKTDDEREVSELYNHIVSITLSRGKS